jgi:phosphopantetheinyl transferase (holo-ACP synthase)
MVLEMNFAGAESAVHICPGIIPGHVARMTVLGRQVLYSACDVPTTRRRYGDQSKMELAHLLWNHIEKNDSVASVADLRGSTDYAERKLRLKKSSLGKPLLRIGQLRGPSIGFSRSDGLMWAALCSGHEEIGLDVASSADFSGAYPFHRICTEQESVAAEAITAGNKPEAGALLWSVKESYVKALGCGFNVFDPLQVRVEALSQNSGAAVFRVSLSEKGRDRLQSYLSRRTLESVFSEPELFEMGEYTNMVAHAETKRLGIVWFSVAIFDKTRFVIH